MISHFLAPDTIALFFARVLLGVLFLFQGYDKIFGVGIKSEVEAMQPSFSKIGMPDFLIKLVAYFTSYAELLGGVLLIVGVLKYSALYLLGIDLIIVSIGMSLLNPVWKMDLVFPRFALLIFLLVYPAAADILTLQHLIAHFR